MQALVNELFLPIAIQPFEYNQSSKVQNLILFISCS